MKIIRILLLFIALVTYKNSKAQRSKIDSLHQLLTQEKKDSNRVKLLWSLAQFYQINKPDTALLLAEQAHTLADSINYIEGESRALNQIANAYNRVGNYPKALEYYIKEQKIEEHRNDPKNLAIAYINIATVYLFQEEYRLAINYTFIADSVIVNNNVKDLRKYSLLNLGDIYEKYGRLDSAMDYSGRAYLVANEEGDENMTGTALNNLANVCLKLENTNLALKNYRKALPLLIRTGDEDMMCETTIGLAKTFLKTGNEDSALHYARFSYSLSMEDGFLSRNLDASVFLNNYFRRHQQFDSAYKYQQQMLVVKDSINSVQRIKEGQLIALNEQARQKELRDQKIKEEAELKHRLQYLSMGVLIPLLFLLTLYLSNKKVKPRLIEYLGLISLLMFFEYVTLLIHPFLLHFTNEVPLFELVVFSVFAAILTRTHHRVENWFLTRLTHSKHQETKHS